MAPIPTPEVLAWRKPAVLALAAVRGMALGRLGEPSIARPPANLCRMHSNAANSPRAYARLRAIRARGRASPGASASNRYSTRSAQSAAHAATRRAVSLAQGLWRSGHRPLMAHMHSGARPARPGTAPRLRRGPVQSC
jgi:hypothetical protein